MHRCIKKRSKCVQNDKRTITRLLHITKKRKHKDSSKKILQIVNNSQNISIDEAVQGDAQNLNFYK